MEYLKHAVELSKKSFEAGAFPAGAVLVSKNGNVYESTPSLPCNHAEMLAIDAAVKAEGVPLTGATLYTSMQPCLMCTAKIFWAGIELVQYSIPKMKTHVSYAYEDTLDTEDVGKHFFRPIIMTHVPETYADAYAVYEAWVKRIEAKK